MVSHNALVFFIRDSLKLPDFIHTQERHAKPNLRSNNVVRDFCSLSPESLRQVTIPMSDHGLPTDVRHINGYGLHVYCFISAAKARLWVKFHFDTLHGNKNWTNAEAVDVVSNGVHAALKATSL